MSLPHTLAVVATLGFSSCAHAPDAGPRLREVDGSSREVVLCVGDSFTDGAGPDGAAAAYPAALSLELETRAPGRFIVVQRSYPGGDSRRLLLDLNAVLKRLRPAITYVLVGVNDGYSIPDPVTEDELDRAPDQLDREGAAVLRCFVGGAQRSIPGLSVEDSRWESAPSPTSESGEGRVETVRGEEFDPVGVWHVAAETLEFTSDGALISRFGRFGWRVISGRVVVNGNGVAYELLARREGGRWILSTLDGRPVVALEPGPAAAQGVVSDLESRRREFEAAANWISALWLARAEVEADRIEDAAGHCAWILARSTFNYPALELLKRLTRTPATRARALIGLRLAHESLPIDDPTRPVVERLDAMFRAPDDPVGCATLLLSAHASERDRRATLRAFRNDSTIQPEHIDRAIEDLDPGPTIASEFREAYSALPDLDHSIAAVLRWHFELIARMCRRFRSEVVVLTYPRIPSPIAPAFADLDAASGANVIEVHREFDTMTAAERSLYIALDGHGTALGYRRVAQIIATDLLARRP